MQQQWVKGLESWGFPVVASLGVYGATRWMPGIDALITQGGLLGLLWLVVCGYLGLMLWYALLDGLGLRTFAGLNR